MSQRVASTVSTERKLPAPKLVLGIAGATIIAMTAGTGWYFIREGSEAPQLRLERALERLDRPDDPAAWEVARRIAIKLRDEGYRNPEFGGATEYILGIVAARALDTGVPPGSEGLKAVKYLEDAEDQGVRESHWPEWAFTLGSLYYKLGRNESARGLLREVWGRPHSRKVAAGLMLVELELLMTNRESNEQIRDMLASLTADPELTPEQHDRTVLLNARFAFSEGRLDDAETSLADFTNEGVTGLEGSILKSRVDFACGRYDEARGRLYPLVFERSATDPPSFAAEAGCLLGECDEKRGEIAAAIRAYERAAHVGPKTFDGITAAIAAARLLQQSGRDEEALQLFQAAITSQSEGEPTVVSVETFRQAIHEGWKKWVERDAFEHAITLAEAAQKVLSQAESYELRARATEQAAFEIEEAWTAGDETSRQSLLQDRIDHWRRSGEAYQELAGVLTDITQSGGALATAADHFRRGHAFREAESALTACLTLKVPNTEPRTLLERGKTRIVLGRPIDALADFEEIIRRYPTDPVAFEAQFLVGQCHFEANNITEAEAAWRELLGLPNLSPDAVEWQEALFALARSSYQRGITAAVRDSMPNETDIQSAILPLDEAIDHFGEFLQRSSRIDQSAEARVLYADAMQRRAGLSLFLATKAETENLRDSYNREAIDLLETALVELRQAQTDLMPRARENRLTRLEQELLKSTYFSIGHVYYLLRRDQEAVVAYGAAMNQSPEDPRVIGTFVRIAECHRRLGRINDARAAIEQAKLLMAQSPNMNLDAEMSALSRPDWEKWLARLSGETLITPVP